MVALGFGDPPEVPQSLSRGLLQGLSAWIEVGGTAPYWSPTAASSR